MVLTSGDKALEQYTRKRVLATVPFRVPLYAEKGQCFVKDSFRGGIRGGELRQGEILSKDPQTLVVRAVYGETVAVER